MARSTGKLRPARPAPSTKPGRSAKRAKPPQRKPARPARPARAAEAAPPALAPQERSGTDRALLDLSQSLAAARAEDEISRAVARAVEALFPRRAFALRLVEPRTLALTTFHGRGRLRPRARSRLVLRAAAAERAGLSAEALRAAGGVVADEDEPIFEDSERALAVPLAVAGELFGVLSLEYDAAAPGRPEQDEPLLSQVAAHAALGVRNHRSLEEVTRLKGFTEDLVEHANALIWAVDRDRRVSAWNAAVARLTGRPRAEVVGGDALRCFAEEERPAIAAALARALAGEPVDLEVRLVRAGGGEARAALSLTPLLGPGADVEGVIATGHDLTLVRTLQAAAEHAERLAAVGRLVAGVVHELNNPLTAITMYSDVLVEKLARGGDPADVEKLRAIKDAGQRIQKLARDLVTYARPTGTKTEAVDLAAVVDEALRMAKPALKEAGARAERTGDPVPVVEANRPSLVQVALALLTNAAQASPPGGVVRAALAAEGGEVVLTVRDDGPGMSPEVHARAFEPFFTTRPGVGIGLGLPIVAGIVERHGGAVELESAPGRGTEVRVRLPIRPAPRPVDATLPRPVSPVTPPVTGSRSP